MKNKNNIKKLVGIATLAALVVVLQLISNYIQFGPVSITLALIPMVMGAIIYGPLCGLGLGMLMGVLIYTAPSTVLFVSYNPGFTILLCLTKTGLAGFISGWVYKGIIRITALRKVRFMVASTAATILAPIINTFLFIVGTAIMFKGLSYESAGEVITLVPSTSFGDAFAGAYSLVVLSNFLIEFLCCLILSPSLSYLLRVLSTKYNLGYSKDFARYSSVNEENNQEQSQEE